MMRVLVCGGRDFTNARLLYSALDAMHRTRPIDCVIEGDARGADRMAGYWAKKNRIDLKIYKADWAKHGNAAGPIRNQKMLDAEKPDIVLACPGGKGTADMMQRARANNVEVVQIA